MTRRDLDRSMGMFEMEEAVWQLLQLAEAGKCPFHQLIVYPRAFFAFANDKATTGFCHLLAYGWIIPGYPNCDFYPSKALAARLREHGVLPPDSPDPLNMVERNERLMKTLTDTEKTKEDKS